MDIAQLFNPVEKITGLEISQGNLRAVFLERTKKGDLVMTHAEAPLPQGIIVNGLLEKKESLIQELKNFQKNNRNIFKSKYVIVSIPTTQTYMDTMKFPPLELDQISESITLNLNTTTLFPLSAQDVYFDWQPITSKDPYHREILLGLAPKKLIDEYMFVCEEVGLEPLAFETPSFSLSRALENFKNKTGLIIRLLSEGIEYSIVSGTELHFCHFTLIPQSENAEDFKIFLKDETQKVLSYYLLEKPHETHISSAVLLAPLHLKKDISDYLATELSLSIENAKFSSSLQVADVDAVAFGASLRGLIKREDDTLISLMSVGTEETYRNRRFISYVSLWSDIITTTALLLVVVFGSAWFFLDITAKKSAEQLSQSYKHNTITDQIDSLEAQAVSFNAIVSSVVSAEQTIYPWSQFVSKIIPELQHDNIHIKNISLPAPDKSFSITIVADNRDAVISFRKDLYANVFFTNVQVPVLGINDKENITQKINLTLNQTTP